MASLQENLARVFTENQTYDHSNNDTFNNDAEEFSSQHHARILRDHEDAMREHELNIADHRRAVDGHSSRRRRDHSRARERMERGYGSDERVAKRRMRFRDKDTDKRRREKGSREERGSEKKERVTDPFGRGAGGQQRARRQSTTPLENTEGQGDGEMDQYRAHPFARPKKDAEYLDPSLSPSQQEDRTSTSHARHRSTHHHKRRKGSSHGDDGVEEEDANPDTAFRTSLFDALADDEGAASYWENVYNQPIHIYPRPTVRPNDDHVSPNLTGEAEDRSESSKLDTMTDDEYVEYVKRKMWERKNPHLVREIRLREERAKEAEEARARTREAGHRYEDEDNNRRQRKGGRGEREGFMRDVDDALLRGQKRQEAKRYRMAWEVYMRKWDELKSATVTVTTPETTADTESRQQDDILHLIPWPVLHLLPSSSAPEGSTTKASLSIAQLEKQITAPAIQAFLRHSPLLLLSSLPSSKPGSGEAEKTAQTAQAEKETSFLSVLKKERARFHPDKILQRFGGEGFVGKDVLRIVTMVFQAVDGLVDGERRGGG